MSLQYSELLALRKPFFSLFILCGVLFGASSLSAWTGPTSNPPSGNVPAPLNVGTANQTKTGGLLTLFNLWVNAALGVTGGATFGGNVGIGNISPTQKLDVTGYVKGTGLCIGADCRTSWPTGGTGFTGSGTANYLTKFTGASALGNSSIFDNGNVGIGTASPRGKLDVTNGGASIWAGLFNYNGGAPSGAYGIWTHGTTYALYADGPIVAKSTLCLGGDCRTSWSSNAYKVQSASCSSSTCISYCPAGYPVAVSGGWSSYWGENIDANMPVANSSGVPIGWRVADPSWRAGTYGTWSVYAVCTK